MREIKFRVWHSKREVFLSINEDPDYFISPSEAGFILIDNGDTVSSNDLIWQQYTGLKDKNGKEIYEGDILKVEAPYEGEDDTQNIVVKWHKDGGYVIEWSSGFNGGDSDLTLLGWAKIEGYQYAVIGNIYKHKHLLDETQP